jgi:hypothetical protein
MSCTGGKLINPSSNGGLYRYVGTWDNSPRFALPTNLTSIAYVDSTSFASGTRYKRKITIKNNIP